MKVRVTHINALMILRGGVGGAQNELVIQKS